MVQSEVADRLVSAPEGKTYGIPSVKLAWYAKAKKVGDIGRKVFWPAPNVDSALVYFERHQTPLADVDSEELFELIDLAFSSRRKMLRSVLSSWIRSDKVFEEAGINPTVRGEALGVLDFVQLLQANKGGNT
jgi:16S rRNA (adenine1518-N6/adenine1519-N6)-dimethyltransferase